MSYIALSSTFQALLKEAQFTKEMLGSGVTQLRKANYASKGVYFQAFTSLSTGLERIGKLCLMLDYYIDHKSFPDLNYMKREIGHKIMIIHEESAAIVVRRSLSLAFLKSLADPIHQSVLRVLSEFAEGDRYSNINVLVKGTHHSDPIASWYRQVDQVLFETRVPLKKKEIIRRTAFGATALGSHTSVLHTSETGNMITSVEDASYRTGVCEAVVPYRQLYVLQIIRYWAEILSALQYSANRSSNDIPYFSEVFAAFYNEDSYLRRRKTWETL